MKRISRDGSIMDDHCIKLEEKYSLMFEVFKSKDIIKIDVIRNALDKYYESCFGEEITNLTPELDYKNNNLGELLKSAEKHEKNRLQQLAQNNKEARDKLKAIKSTVDNFLRSGNSDKFDKELDKLRKRFDINL